MKALTLLILLDVLTTVSLSLGATWLFFGAWFIPHVTIPMIAIGAAVSFYAYLNK